MTRCVTALAAALGCAALAVQWGRNMAARCGALRAWRRVLTRMEAGMSLYADLPSLLFFAAEGEENGEVAQELFGCARRMRDDPRCRWQWPPRSCARLRSMRPTGRRLRRCGKALEACAARKAV